MITFHTNIHTYTVYEYIHFVCVIVCLFHSFSFLVFNILKSPFEEMRFFHQDWHKSLRERFNTVHCLFLCFWHKSGHIYRCWVSAGTIVYLQLHKKRQITFAIKNYSMGLKMCTDRWDDLVRTGQRKEKLLSTLVQTVDENILHIMAWVCLNQSTLPLSTK